MEMTALFQAGARLQFDGEIVEVVRIEAGRVTLLGPQRRWSTVGMSEFLSSAKAVWHGEEPPPPLGPRLAALSEVGRKAVCERAAHVRELLTGYRSGTSSQKGPGEPRPEYDPDRPLMERQAAKARELGLTDRTIRRWVSQYADEGEAGLVDSRLVPGRGSRVDPRWDQACRLIMDREINASTPTAGALLRMVKNHLDEQYEEGEVPRPSQATAYRHLARLAKGRNAVEGSSKGRRSIAERPKDTYGRLRATRPGEYAILDTQDLDVFAMEPVTCRWVGVQLTVVQDLFTRCVTGLRLTPVSTKAVDVAGVLYEAMAPQPAPEGWPAEAYWAYHGIPRQLVMSEEQLLAGVPACPPETIVIDYADPPVMQMSEQQPWSRACQGRY